MLLLRVASRIIPLKPKPLTQTLNKTLQTPSTNYGLKTGVEVLRTDRGKAGSTQKSWHVTGHPKESPAGSQESSYVDFFGDKGSGLRVTQGTGESRLRNTEGRVRQRYKLGFLFKTLL